jgi:hypothetical protein
MGFDHCIDGDPNYYRTFRKVSMKTVITLNHDDVINVLQAHAAQLVRVDFTPNNVKLSVKPWDSKDWKRGEVSMTIEVEGASEDHIS